jgi:cellobiose phosphorylase
MADRAFDLAWTHSQVTLHHLNATEAEAQLYGRLAGALIYADPARRASPRRAAQQPARPKRALELWHLRATRRSSCCASATRTRSRSSGN